MNKSIHFCPSENYMESTQDFSLKKGCKLIDYKCQRQLGLIQ